MVLGQFYWQWRVLTPVVVGYTGYRFYYQVSRSSRLVYGCHLMQIIVQCLFGLFHYTFRGLGEWLTHVGVAGATAAAINYRAQGVNFNNEFLQKRTLNVLIDCVCLPLVAMNCKKVAVRGYYNHVCIYCI